MSVLAIHLLPLSTMPAKQYRYYRGWLPHPAIAKQYLEIVSNRVKASPRLARSPPVEELGNVIRNDPIAKYLFDHAILQANKENKACNYRILFSYRVSNHLAGQGPSIVFRYN